MNPQEFEAEVLRLFSKHVLAPTFDKLAENTARLVVWVQTLIVVVTMLVVVFVAR